MAGAARQTLQTALRVVQGDIALGERTRVRELYAHLMSAGGDGVSAAVAYS